VMVGAARFHLLTWLRFDEGFQRRDVAVEGGNAASLPSSVRLTTF